MTPEQLAEIRKRYAVPPAGPQQLVADLAALLAHVEALEKEHEEDQGVIRVWRGRCERAEADNAALALVLEEALDTVERIQEMRRHGRLVPELAVSILREDLDRHGERGAALLEENRRLRARVAELAGVLGLLTPQHDQRWRYYQHEDGCPNMRDEHAECRCDGEEALKRIDAARATLEAKP